MNKKPALDRIFRKVHDQLKKETDAVVEFIRECQKPFPKVMNSQYINDRLPGGKYHTKAQTKAYDELLVLDGEAMALVNLAYQNKISLERIEGISKLVGNQEVEVRYTSTYQQA